MNDEELRIVRPTERPLPPHRRTEIKEMLMPIIAKDTASARRGTRRRITLGAIAALVTVGAATAAAAGVISRDRPDPAQAQTVNREMGSDSPLGEAHIEGWRPELSAETVECVLPKSDHLITLASEFPLEDMLTERHLVDECTAGNDLVRSGMTGPVSDVHVCTNSDDYPRPVVLADGTTCAGTGGLRQISPSDLEDLNRRRAFDVSLLAVPSDRGCPTLDQAREWAKEQVDNSEYHLRIDTRGEGAACYRGVTDWSRKVILVQALGPQAR
jgi:hypothetical protein